MPPTPEDLVGRRFGRLSVLQRCETDDRKRRWTCLCDCGNVKVVQERHLKQGHTKSCGCYQRERASQAVRKKNPEGRMTSSRLYRHRLSLGVCPRCGGARDDGRTSCSACRVKAAAYVLPYRRKLTQERRANKICLRCGAPCPTRFARCDNCRAKGAVTSARHGQVVRDRSGCAACGGIRDTGKKVCSICRARMKELRDARLAQGLCVECGDAGVAGTRKRLCMKCWFKSAAGCQLHSRKRWHELKALWDRQGGRCAYTGATLTPGMDASLDHIQPRSKGGTHDLVNLQWVLKQVNRVKANCTHEEFLALCRLVAHRFPS